MFVRETQAVARRAGGQADVREVRPGFIHILAQVGFGVWRGIGRDDVETPGEILSGPTGADDSCADDGDSLDRFVV